MTPPTASDLDKQARELAEQIVRKWRKAPAVGEEMKVRDITAALQAAVVSERERIKVATEAILFSEEEREETEYNEAWNDALGEVLWKILPNTTAED